MSSFEISVAYTYYHIVNRSTIKATYSYLSKWFKSYSKQFIYICLLFLRTFIDSVPELISSVQQIGKA